MEIKTLEIRDRATFIPVIAIRPGPRNEAERYLWGRVGFGTTAARQEQYTLVGKIGIDELHYDPRRWNNARMTEAHMYISRNWDAIENGQVIDIEYLLGETDKPKESERLLGVTNISLRRTQCRMRK